MKEYLSNHGDHAFLTSDRRAKPIVCVETGVAYPSLKAAEKSTGSVFLNKYFTLLLSIVAKLFILQFFETLKSGTMPISIRAQNGAANGQQGQFFVLCDGCVTVRVLHFAGKQKTSRKGRKE